MSFYVDLRTLYRDAQAARKSEYKDGYLAALEEVLELWEENDG
jgi:hypothetical protein